MEFRPLNNNEIKCLEWAQSQGRHNQAKPGQTCVLYEWHGNFCVCIVKYDYVYRASNGIQVCSPFYHLIGVSHRSPEDRPNDIKDEMLALKRALIESE
jgi:hypothetical protein